MMCYRKHSLFTKQYQIYFRDKEIQLGENNKKIKYIINLSPKTCIEWQIKTETDEINGFWIIWKKQQKLFQMDAENCNIFKQKIDGLVSYGKFQMLYQPVHLISNNSYGSLIKMRYLVNHTHYICKMIKKNLHYGDEEFFNQIEILNSLKHKNILKFREIYNCNKCYHFIYDFPKGGSLANIIQNKTLNIEEIQIIIQQLLEVLNYIHQKGYIHRNLKPENIFFLEENDYTSLVISEFELCCKIIECDKKQLNLGNQSYSAPEFKRKFYSQKSDIFSCGLILYKMLTKKDLIDHESNTLDEKLMFHLLIHSNIDENFQNILTAMLQFDPKFRLSAEDTLNLLNQMSIQEQKQSHFLDKLNYACSVNDEIISLVLVSKQEEPSLTLTDSDQDSIQKLPYFKINKKLDNFI